MSGAGAAAIAEGVRSILAEVGARADLSDVTDTDSLLSSNVVDSVAMVNLVTALEERFGILIDNAELTPEHFDSVEAIVRLVSRKSGAS
jgi:acyl carrier protein